MASLGEANFGLADFEEDIIDRFAFPSSSFWEPRYIRTGVFRFLDLYGELRNRVYGYCLRDWIISATDVKYTSSGARLYTDLPMLAVCKQVQAEFLHLLIRRKFIIFEVKQLAYPDFLFRLLQRDIPLRPAIPTNHITTFLSSSAVGEADNEFLKFQGGVTVQAQGKVAFSQVGPFAQHLVAGLIRGAHEVQKWQIRMKIVNTCHNVDQDATEERKKIFDDFQTLQTQLRYWTLLWDKTWTLEYFWRQGTRYENDVRLFYIVLHLK